MNSICWVLGPVAVNFLPAIVAVGERFPIHLIVRLIRPNPKLVPFFFGVFCFVFAIDSKCTDRYVHIDCNRNGKNWFALLLKYVGEEIVFC